MKYLRQAAVLIVLTTAGAVASHATPLQTYTDLTSWSAAVTQLGDDTFEGQAPKNAYVSYNTASGYTENGVNFVGYLGSSNSLQIIDAGLAPWYNFGTGASLATTTSGSSTTRIVVNLPAAITAFATNLMVTGNAGLPLTVTASDGSVFTVPSASHVQSFLGATFAVPITGLTITMASEPAGTVILLDNFRFATVNAGDPPPPQDPGDTPELASMLLIGTGLVGMATFRKRAV